MKPSYLVGFDTEDDSQGTPTLFAFVHEEGSWTGTERDGALGYLERLGKAKKAEGFQVQAWATNLEYDLVNLFGRERLRDIRLNFGRSHLVGATWGPIHFRDTLRHVPVSVADLGDIVGLPKLEKNFSSVEYCLRDAAITFRAAKLFREAYAEEGQYPRLTIASTAFNIWKRKYWKREIWRPLKEVWRGALEAYHGGRTEPFALGEFPDVKAIDAASMFPWAMITAPLPLPWGCFSRVQRDGDFDPSGIYRVRVNSDLERPLLPYRSCDGTVYPNGKFTGWYVGEELQAFGALGGRVRVLEGFKFLEEAEPFASYVRSMFRKKQRSRGAKRTMFKYLLNTLYGKFGQKGEKVEALSLARFLELKTAPLDYRIWEGLCIFTKKADPPPWSNMVWPAFVTARARVRLHKEILKIMKAGGKPLYCDTDSVIFQGGRIRYPASTKIPGTFENRGAYKVCLIVGKKEYGLQGPGGWEIHVKGVPRSERETYLRTGRARYKLPAKIRESARRGLQPNIWTEREKVRRVNFEKRSRKPDGSLLPVTV